MTFPPLVRRYTPIAQAAAKRYGVPYKLIFSVMLWESGGQDIRRPNSAGAIGIMQIVPEAHPECTDLVSTRGQIDCGTRILRDYNESAGWGKEGIEYTLARYYAGPGYVQSHSRDEWADDINRYVAGIYAIYERETKNDRMG